jgi:hypothetical protein
MVLHLKVFWFFRCLTQTAPSTLLVPTATCTYLIFTHRRPPQTVRLYLHSNGLAPNTQQKGPQTPWFERGMPVRAQLHVALCLGAFRMVVDSTLTKEIVRLCTARQCKLPRHPQDRYNLKRLLALHSSYPPRSIAGTFSGNPMFVSCGLRASRP